MKHIQLKTLAFLALAGGLVAPASAQAPVQDVRCLIVSNVYAKAAAEEPARRRATLNAIFYLGRVTATTTSAPALKSLIAAQAKHVNMSDAAATMTACAQRMATHSNMLQDVAQQLSQEQAKRR